MENRRKWYTNLNWKKRWYVSKHWYNNNTKSTDRDLNRFTVSLYGNGLITRIIYISRQYE